MKQFELVHQDFKDIFAYDDFAAPFVAFTKGVRNLRPNPDEISRHSKQNTSMLKVIRLMRAIRSSTRGEDNGYYFRGSGIVVVADPNELLAVDYRRDGLRPDLDNTQLGDPVADHWGNYQHVALEKAGRAALALRLAPTTASIDIYRAVNDVMVEQGLLEDRQIPHHIGYQFSERGLVVAASGMLPSPSTAARTEALHRRRLEEDKAKGWVEWDGDYFAGYYDQVASEHVLGGIMAARLVIHTPPMAEGVNLH